MKTTAENQQRTRLHLGRGRPPKRASSGVHSPDQTRTLLLKAAKKLFASRGYDGTSVKELAEEAKVNVSLVSYHFGGKEGLFRACIDQFARSRLEVAQRLLLPPASQEEFRIRLQMFADELLNYFVEEPELTKIIQRECENDWPIVEDIFQKTLLKAFEKLVGFLAAAQKKGIVRRNLDPATVTILIIGGMTHFARTETLSKKYFDRTLGSSAYREQVRETIVSVVLNGITR
ncbi:MAG: TetR family transcriptional regulator [Bdellovibrionota bacterium]